MSENIRLTSKCRAVTTAVPNADARDSSTPGPAESDRTESDERSDYDSSGDKEAREEYLSVEASDNLGNWNRDNKSEKSGIGGTKEKKLWWEAVFGNPILGPLHSVAG